MLNGLRLVLMQLVSLHYLVLNLLPSDSRLSVSGLVGVYRSTGLL